MHAFTGVNPNPNPFSLQQKFSGVGLLPREGYCIVTKKKLKTCNSRNGFLAMFSTIMPLLKNTFLEYFSD